MLRNTIFLASLFIAMSSFGSQCAHKCHVFGIGNSTSPILANPSDFMATGGYTQDLKEMCMFKLSVRGEILVFAINDIFGQEAVLSIRRGSQLLVSSNFSGKYGSVSYYEKDVRLSCTK